MILARRYSCYIGIEALSLSLCIGRAFLYAGWRHSEGCSAGTVRRWNMEDDGGHSGNSEYAAVRGYEIPSVSSCRLSENPAVLSVSIKRPEV